MNKTVLFFLGTVFVFGVGGALADNAEWVRRLEAPDRESLAAMNLLADKKGDIRIRVRDPENGNVLEVSVNGSGTRCRFYPDDFFSDDLKKRVAAFPCPPHNGGLRWFALKRAADVWVAYIDEQPVLRMPELWPGGLELMHPAVNAPGEDEEDDYTQRLGSFKFEDNFLVPAGSEFPPTWEIMSGVWSLHSVTGSISGSSGGYQLARQPRPEKSPNFYTLEGGGTNAVVLAGEPFYSRYVFRAEAHAELLDTVETELPAGQWLLLEVQLHDDRIICRADNIEVIRRKMPLPPGGRFGLFTTMPEEVINRFYCEPTWSHMNGESADPLQEGSLGIWAYRNSMMVARIKIAAESVKPRPFAFKAVPPGSVNSSPKLAGFEAVEF